MYKLFDLNIEQVLEHWEVKHALREIIANAMDEKILSESSDIKIYKENDSWIIRDYGRGLQDIHFTQNENEEKHKSTVLIGKFGVGLKDALAVFHRKGIRVEINSKYAHITTQMANKDGFGITTLHAVFTDSLDGNMKGTEFRLYGVKDNDMEDAKSMFLKFNENVTFLEKTKYGEVYSCKSQPAIYINGVQVAFEDNFMFSYNITNINAEIKKALNRERNNVGRTAYTDTIQKILKNCKSENVIMKLVKDIENIDRGTNKEEISWKGIQVYIVKYINENKENVVTMTREQYYNLSNSEREILENNNSEIVWTTDSVYSSVKSNVNTWEDVYSDYKQGFEYRFIKFENLSDNEKTVFELKNKVIDFLAKKGYKCNIDIKISETIRIDSYGNLTNGCYDPVEKALIIKRKVLKNKVEFLGVLFHEFIHYAKGHDDNTREFENDLTDLLGYLAEELFLKKSNGIISTIFNGLYKNY